MSDRPVSIEVQIACVRREIGMRERVYPRWVATSKMSQDSDPWNDGILPCEHCDGEGYEWWR